MNARNWPAEAIERITQAEAERDFAIEVLREIATRRTTERNPDGVEQAAASMQLIARAALDKLGERDAP